MWSIQPDWCTPSRWTFTQYTLNWCILVDANGNANTNVNTMRQCTHPPSYFTSSFLRLSHDGMHTMECVQRYAHGRWNPHDGIRTMESTRWNSHNGIRTMESAWWNPYDGIRTMECARWNSHDRTPGPTMECARWNLHKGMCTMNSHDGIHAMGWNPHDGMESTRWDGIHTMGWNPHDGMEFAWWNQHDGISMMESAWRNQHDGISMMESAATHEFERKRGCARANLFCSLNKPICDWWLRGVHRAECSVRGVHCLNWSPIWEK